jgi:hypothetical protein
MALSRTCRFATMFFPALVFDSWVQNQYGQIGREVAISRHLQDCGEYQLTVPKPVAFGGKLFANNVFNS